MVKKTLALQLLDFSDSGVITRFLQFYSSKQAVRHAIRYHSMHETSTSVWVCWSYDEAGNKLLLFSSRPLAFSYVKPSPFL